MDDLFVIVQCWSNIPAHVHQTNSVEERIGLAMKHAVSTSFRANELVYRQYNTIARYFKI